MNRALPALLLLTGSSLLVIACPSSEDVGGDPVDPGTSSSTSTSAEPTTAPTTTGATGTSTTTGPSAPDPTTGASTGGSSTGDADPGDPSSGTTDGPSPSCGDGVIDPGEECDLSAAVNDDQGACTLECKTAKCGDKLVWAGKEACDDGPNNNDNLYGGCTTQCQRGPRCDDGQLQGPEECDLGPDNGTGEFPPNGVPCDDGCRYDAKLVFLSSVSYKGGDLDGAMGADQKCRALANAASLDNAANFKAWISDAQHSPAKDFIKTPGKPYVRPDGVRIADDWQDLTLNGPDDGIIVTEAGETMPDEATWTGTSPDGALTPDTLTCLGWSSSKAGDKGRRGHSGFEDKQGPEWMQWVENAHWTSRSIGYCLTAHRIYCFEQ